MEKFLEKSFNDFFRLYDMAIRGTGGESLSTARSLIIQTFVEKLECKEKDMKIKLKVKSARVYDLFLKIKEREHQFEIDCKNKKVKVLK